MGRKRIYEVVKHLPAEELDERLKSSKRYKSSQKTFINIFTGMSVEEAAELVGVPRLHDLKGNSRGYEGLIPEFEEDPLNLQRIRRKNSEKC